MSSSERIEKELAGHMDPARTFRRTFLSIFCGRYVSCDEDLVGQRNSLCVIEQFPAILVNSFEQGAKTVVVR